MNDYTEEFNQERAKYKKLAKNSKIVSKISAPVLRKMMKAVEDKDTWVWPFAIGLALLNDFIDILVIGSIPFLGDIIDITTGFILFMFLFNIGGHIRIKVRVAIILANFFEFIPFVDFIPVWTICILYAWHIVRKRGKKAEEGLRTKNRRIISEFAS